jgi:hypothetical protein
LHVHHYDQTDHLRRAVEISERVAHGLRDPFAKFQMFRPPARKIRFGILVGVQ